MHIRVRTFGKPDTIVAVDSKLTKIDQFRKLIKEKFDIEPIQQRLFYGGKLLEDGYTFHDYHIKLNDVIQLMVCPMKRDDDNIETNKDSSQAETTVQKEQKIVYKDADSPYYLINDLVDVKDAEHGAWFEGKVVRIVYDPKYLKSNPSDQQNSEVSNTNGQKELPPANVPNSNESPKSINSNDKMEVEHTLKDDNSDICRSPSTSGEKKTKGKGIADYFSKVQSSPKLKDKKLEAPPETRPEPKLLYKIQFEPDEEEDYYHRLEEIRPRARTVISVQDLKVGQKVMVNHNTDNYLEKGYWYDFKVEEIKKLRVNHELIGTLYLGMEGIQQGDTRVRVHDKIFKIEDEVVPVSERTPEYQLMMTTEPDKRSAPINCLTCRDVETLPCKDCGCYQCSGKEDPDKIVLCDECDRGYHLACLSPPLEALPDDDWYCEACRRDPTGVVAPGGRKQPKKTTRTETNRDWGRGMACVGKTKTCTMPLNHFGPIPGIEVGMRWRFRIQISESGVHRPPVSGIHGRDFEGAYSIVLSGGYEDDYDDGYEFTYTGAGGRDLSGNKRTAEQSTDQKLTRENKALARNCAVKTVSEQGGDAGEKWREGKPVRVVRSYKMMKHFPKFAPDEGIRYDGIYKVVKYYPEVGLSGYRVWKYLLRRDDPSPAPWEPQAKVYPIVYPDGYLEAEAEKKAQKEKGYKQPKSVTKKRALKESNQDASPPKKRQKPADSPTPKKPGRKSKNKSIAESPQSRKLPSIFTKSPKADKKDSQTEAALTQTELEVIRADKRNEKLWEECVSICREKGRKGLVEHVTEQFLCIICQDVCARPVTTTCAHNFCLECLKRAFKSTGSQSCPHCRQSLVSLELTPNEQLTTALRTILPGYDATRTA